MCIKKLEAIADMNFQCTKNDRHEMFKGQTVVAHIILNNSLEINL